MSQNIGRKQRGMTRCLCLKATLCNKEEPSTTRFFIILQALNQCITAYGLVDFFNSSLRLDKTIFRNQMQVYLICCSFK